MTGQFYRYQGKAWDTHFLPRLSKLQVSQLPNKEEALVILPIGATEQHGPHLPTFTDTLINEGMLTAAFDQLPDDCNIWTLAAIPYGKSNEHYGQPGTITLSAQTLMSIVLDIADSLTQSGFKKLLLFNTHGGNSALLNMMGREIRIATGMNVFRMDGGGLGIGAGIIDEREQKFGLHGGDLETSIVLAIKENWVDMNVAPNEIPNFPAGYTEKGSTNFAWIMNDISESGVAGNATLATMEKGKELIALSGEKIAIHLLEMKKFNLNSVKSGNKAK
ncbi:creatininase family protein [Paenibacillus endoradicis]|uniref:creatininase family protein n=1 Tax=Paenibacillus endoradicis TaxID=2972487 RepID=UPI00215969C0|nr:creatininase family protein [Paenibacillus endoradicis]MCR8657144.1 creatininase family protein [Paenibacillus endoradicis]